MDKPTIETVNKAMHELKVLVISNTFDEEKRTRINAVLDSYEDSNQKLVAAQQRLEGFDDEIKQVKVAAEEKGVEAGKLREKIDAMEAEFARATAASTADKDFREGDEFKALNAWVRAGTNGVGDLVGVTAEQKAILRTDSAVQGGTLVTSEMDSLILKAITEIDGFRPLARVKTIGSKALEVPIRTSIPTATYEGEAATGQDKSSTYGNETVTPYRQTFTVAITNDMLMDAAFNMEQEITSDAAEAFAYGEGNGFIAGTGVRQPQGITQHAGLITAARAGTAGGTASKINPVDIIGVAGSLKVGYNPVYLMHRATLADIRSTRLYVDDTGSGGGAGTGAFLWNPAMDTNNPATINGYPYVLMPSMPLQGSSTLALAFGDFRRGYTIVDRTGVSIIRDEYARKRDAVVEFTINRWNTGAVTLSDSIVLQKCLSA